MVTFPFDKYLAQDYRKTLRTGDSPQNIDTDSPLLPVIDIQKGFPTPNSKQKLRTAYIQSTASAVYQIATVTATRKIYLIGVTAATQTGTSHEVSIWDATSGTIPSATANTLYTDESQLIAPRIVLASAGQVVYYNFPFPKEMITGIRAQIGGASSTLNTTIYWIEEIV